MGLKEFIKSVFLYREYDTKAFLKAMKTPVERRTEEEKEIIKRVRERIERETK